MDVIRKLLTEEDIRNIGQDMLNSLAKCSTTSVMLEIRRYLNSPDASEDVKDMVKLAYYDELNEIVSQSDNELITATNIITELQFSEIDMTVPLDQLKLWKGYLSKMKEKGDFRPYKAPIKLFNIKEIISILKEQGHGALAKKLLLGKNVFSEVSTARAVGTPFKRAFFQSTNTEVKEKGIDFLIRMKEAGVAASSWRFL